MAEKNGEERRSRGPRRGRREATTEAILDAAEELFAAGGPESVSVRDIAARAGVSHALVHRYLGKKTEIYDAVLSRDQGRIVRAAQDAPDLRSAVHLMLADVLGDRREYMRLISHSVLHGLEWEASGQGSPAVRWLVELASTERERGLEPPGIDDLDYRFVVAAVVAMAMGWVTAEPWLVRAAGITDLDDAQITRALTEMAMRMMGGVPTPV